MTLLPPLRSISLTRPIQPPRKIIKDDADVESWKHTTGYKDYCLFVARLNDAIIERDIPSVEQEERNTAVQRTLGMLDELDSWIDDIPPYGDKQRFGNLAFRDWGARLAKRMPYLMEEMLPDTLTPAIPLLTPYLLEAFGNFARLDYGSGHELCFALFLMGLTLIRFFEPKPAEERQLVLVVFLRYLRLIWKLQDVYRLEPAGSHGVWGIDDYHFLGFLWGSSQLRDHTTYRPADVLKPPLPCTDLYNLSVSRIYELKIGPFYEHSAQLFSIASSVPHWAKVNSGMMKMYEGEVLGKRVVVQHTPLDGLVVWDADPAPKKSTGHNIVRSMHPAQRQV